MDRASNPSPANAPNSLVEAIRATFTDAVAALLAIASFERGRSLESEVRALVEPHLPILTHKRRRFFGDDLREHELWTKELDSFVVRAFFWPTPATTEAFALRDRQKIAAIVDKIVANEQLTQDVAETMLPQT